MHPLPTAAERFAIILLTLAQAVAARSGVGMPSALIALIVDRLRRIKQRFASIAARVAAGRYRPCHGKAAPRPGQKPSPDRLPRKFGWLLPLLPDAVGYRAQLEHLLRDPEMAALLEAAPASLRRPLRSLCRMLGLPPPLSSAPPPRKTAARRRRPKPAPPSAMRAAPTATPPPQAPARRSPRPA